MAPTEHDIFAPTPEQEHLEERIAVLVTLAHHGSWLDYIDALNTMTGDEARELLGYVIHEVAAHRIETLKGVLTLSCGCVVDGPPATARAVWYGGGPNRLCVTPAHHDTYGLIVAVTAAELVPVQ